MAGRDAHVAGRGTQEGGEDVELEAEDDTEDDSEVYNVGDGEEEGKAVVPLDSVVLEDVLKLEVSELVDELTSWVGVFVSDRVVTWVESCEDRLPLVVLDVMLLMVQKSRWL